MKGMKNSDLDESLNSSQIAMPLKKIKTPKKLRTPTSKKKNAKKVLVTKPSMDLRNQIMDNYEVVV